MKTIAQILVAALFSVLLFFAFWYGRSYEVKPVSTQGKTTTIGVILVGPVRDGGWSEAHYNSFEAIRQRMNLNVLYRESVNTQDGSVVRVIDELVREKAEMIFVLSFSYGQHLQESVKKYPGVKFFHAAGVVQGPNLATYFGRIYQARYLSGIVAGMQSKTGHIGFVGAHPIAEVIQGINAFTLGVRSVNPQATVHVAWTGSWYDPVAEKREAERLFDSHPIDVMAQHQDTTIPVEVAKSRGAYAIGYHLDHSADFPETFLTAPVWNWGTFYTERLNECFEGRFAGKNYLESIETGMVDIAPLTAIVAPGTQEAVEKARKRLLSRTWDVFYGPVFDQQGNLRIGRGENISDDELLARFDWFVEGVDGKIK